jgi:hypothetical protein
MFNVHDKVRLNPDYSLEEIGKVLNISIDTLRSIRQDNLVGRVAAIVLDDYYVEFPGIAASYRFIGDFLVSAETDEFDLFRRTIHSVASFYDRFGLEMNVRDTHAVFEEELREFQQASTRLLNSSGISEQTRYETALEVADVFYTLIGYALALGVTPQQLVQAVEKKVAVNDSKNANTHHVVVDPTTGKRKVTRRNLYIIAPSHLVARNYADGRPFQYVPHAAALAGAAGEVVVLQSPYLSVEHRGAIEHAKTLASMGSVVLTMV